MTTYFPFAPSRRSVPQFAPTLDGAQHSCSCTWSLFGQRYYLNCFDQNGALVFSKPIVETPAAAAINALSWSAVAGKVMATTQSPHGYKIGSVVELTIAGCLPDAYNGTFMCVITGAASFTFAMVSDPGANVAAGSFSFLIDIAAGYFSQSAIIYRNGSFEVSP